MKWIDVWEEEPPYHENILVFVDGDVHVGDIQGFEKLRKVDFWDSYSGENFEFDGNAPVEQRVTHWMPLPEPPKGRDNGVD